jgi:hypothetical protein
VDAGRERRCRLWHRAAPIQSSMGVRVDPPTPCHLSPSSISPEFRTSIFCIPLARQNDRIANCPIYRGPSARSSLAKSCDVASVSPIAPGAVSALATAKQNTSLTGARTVIWPDTRSWSRAIRGAQVAVGTPPRAAPLVCPSEMGVGLFCSPRVAIQPHW